MTKNFFRPNEYSSINAHNLRTHHNLDSDHAKHNPRCLFAILEIRHLTRGLDAPTDVIMKICDKFDSKEMVEAVNKFGITHFLNLEDYREEYGFPVVTIVAVFFEGADVLLEQDLTDIKMVDRLFVPTLYLL